MSAASRKTAPTARWWAGRHSERPEALRRTRWRKRRRRLQRAMFMWRMGRCWSMTRRQADGEIDVPESVRLISCLAEQAVARCLFSPTMRCLPSMWAGRDSSRSSFWRLALIKSSSFGNRNRRALRDECRIRLMGKDLGKRGLIGPRPVAGKLRVLGVPDPPARMLHFVSRHPPSACAAYPQ